MIVPWAGRLDKYGRRRAPQVNAAPLMSWSVMGKYYRYKLIASVNFVGPKIQVLKVAGRILDLPIASDMDLWVYQYYIYLVDTLLDIQPPLNHKQQNRLSLRNVREPFGSDL